MMFSKALVLQKTCENDYLSWRINGITKDNIHRALEMAPFIVKDKKAMEEVFNGLTLLTCQSSSSEKPWARATKQTTLIKVMLALFKETRILERNLGVKYTFGSLLETLVVNWRSLFREFAEAFDSQCTERKRKLLKTEIALLGQGNVLECMKKFVNSEQIAGFERKIVFCTFEIVDDLLDDLPALVKSDVEFNFIQEITANSITVSLLYTSLSGLEIEASKLSQAEEIFFLMLMCKFSVSLDFCREAVSVSTKMEVTKTIREKVISERNDISSQSQEFGVLLKQCFSAACPAESLEKFANDLEIVRKLERKDKFQVFVSHMFMVAKLSSKETEGFLDSMDLAKFKLLITAVLLQVKSTGPITEDSISMDIKLIQFRQKYIKHIKHNQIIIGCITDRLSCGQFDPSFDNKAFRKMLTCEKIEPETAEIKKLQANLTIEAMAGESGKYLQTIFSRFPQVLSSTDIVRFLAHTYSPSVWITFGLCFASQLQDVPRQELGKNLAAKCKINDLTTKFDRSFKLPQEKHRVTLVAKASRTALREGMNFMDYLLTYMATCMFTRDQIKLVHFELMSRLNSNYDQISDDFEARWSFYSVLYQGLHIYIHDTLKDEGIKSLEQVSARLATLAARYKFDFRSTGIDTLIDKLVNKAKNEAIQSLANGIKHLNAAGVSLNDMNANAGQQQSADHANLQAICSQIESIKMNLLN